MLRQASVDYGCCTAKQCRVVGRQSNYVALSIQYVSNIYSGLGDGCQESNRG